MKDFVKLTNCRPGLEGQPVVLRKDIIVSVFRGPAEREDSDPEMVTFVYAPPHGTWEVEETVDQVLDLLDN